MLTIFRIVYTGPKWVIISTPSDVGEVVPKLRSISVFRSQQTSSLV